MISLRASNSRGLGPAVYATVRTKPPAADEDELDDGDEEGDDEDERDEPPPLIPPVGVKVRGLVIGDKGVITVIVVIM